MALILPNPTEPISENTPVTGSTVPKKRTRSMNPCFGFSLIGHAASFTP